MVFRVFLLIQGKKTDHVKCWYESMNSVPSASMEKLYSHVMFLQIYHVISCKCKTRKFTVCTSKNSGSPHFCARNKILSTHLN